MSERQIAKIIWRPKNVKVSHEVVHYYKKRAERHIKEILKTGKFKGRKSKYEGLFSTLIEPVPEREQTAETDTKTN